MRRLALATVLLLAPMATTASAQTLSGPGVVIPSPVCDFVNFGFCPQPPAPPPPLPDPNERMAAPAVAPPPATRPRHPHRRHHRA